MTNNSELNLYQKLAKIRKAVEVIQKNKAGYGYKYVSEDEIFSKLSVQLDKLGLLLVPKIVEDSVDLHFWDIETAKMDKKTKEIIPDKKAEVVVHGQMVFSWINTENPEERLDVPWFFTGQQADASQAFGSGLTYCTRYFLLKFFNIATPEDDPDTWRSKQQLAAKEEDMAIVKGVVDQVDSIVHDYIASSRDDDKAREEVFAIVKKYVKSGNYKKIEEPALATKLLAEVKTLASKPEAKAKEKEGK